MYNLVIFGTARTGSSLLKSLLNAHPSIHCDGEILNPTFWTRPTRPRLLYRVCYRYPQVYITLRRFAVQMRYRCPIYGFKLFERHVHEPGQVLSSLTSAGWRILYLWRRSVFDRTLSALVGAATDHWISTVESPSPGLSITISQAEFMQTAAFVHTQQVRCAAIMREIPHLEIVYEDDLRQAENWQPLLDRIYAFLEIPSSPAVSPVRQTWRRPYHEFVSNYAELVDAFQQSSLADTP
jgi:hypothetical protein